MWRYSYKASVLQSTLVFSILSCTHYDGFANTHSGMTSSVDSLWLLWAFEGVICK